MLKGINDLWLSILVTLILVGIRCLFLCVSLCVSPFLVWLVLNNFLWVFWEYLSFLGLSFSSSTFCRAGILNKYCLNLVLSWNIFFSRFIVSESFSDYSNLNWHLWSLRVCKILWWEVNCNLTGLPLYSNWSFSLAAFKILSLFCTFSVLIIMWLEDFFLVQSIWCSVSFLYIYKHLIL